MQATLPMLTAGHGFVPVYDHYAMGVSPATCAVDPDVYTYLLNSMGYSLPSPEAQQAASASSKREARKKPKRANIVVSESESLATNTDGTETLMRSQKIDRRAVVSEDTARLIQEQIRSAASTPRGSAALDKLARKQEKERCATIALDEFRLLIRADFQIKPDQLSDKDVDAFAHAMDEDGSGTLSVDALFEFINGTAGTPEPQAEFVGDDVADIMQFNAFSSSYFGSLHGNSFAEEPLGYVAYVTPELHTALLQLSRATTYTDPAVGADPVVETVTSKRSVERIKSADSGKKRKVMQESARRMQQLLKLATFHQPITKLLKKFDKDRSGTFEEEELKALFRRQLRIPPDQLSDKDIQTVIRELDTDGSGQLSIEEIADFVDKGQSYCRLLDCESEEAQAHETSSEQPTPTANTFGVMRNQPVRQTSKEGSRRSSLDTGAKPPDHGAKPVSKPERPNRQRVESSRHNSGEPSRRRSGRPEGSIRSGDGPTSPSKHPSQHSTRSMVSKDQTRSIASKDQTRSSASKDDDQDQRAETNSARVGQSASKNGPAGDAPDEKSDGRSGGGPEVGKEKSSPGKDDGGKRSASVASEDRSPSKSKSDPNGGSKSSRGGRRALQSLTVESVRSLIAREAAERAEKRKAATTSGEHVLFTTLAQENGGLLKLPSPDIRRPRSGKATGRHGSPKVSVDMADMPHLPDYLSRSQLPAVVNWRAGSAPHSARLRSPSRRKRPVVSA